MERCTRLRSWNKRLKRYVRTERGRCFQIIFRNGQRKCYQSLSSSYFREAAHQNRMGRGRRKELLMVRLNPAKRGSQRILQQPLLRSWRVSRLAAKQGQRRSKRRVEGRERRKSLERVPHKSQASQGSKQEFK